VRGVRSHLWVYLPEDGRAATTLDREAQLLAALKAAEALLAAEKGLEDEAARLAGEAIAEVAAASIEPALQGCRPLAAEPLPGRAVKVRLAGCSEGEAVLIPSSEPLTAEEALERAYRPSLLPGLQGQH